MDASPFHTSMFITNMASIGMPAVHHHIYNFGTTSLFFSIGSVQRTVSIGPDGQPVRKRLLPIGITADERICAGATYAKLVGRMVELLNNPELLETPPETVHFDEGIEYSLPKPKKSRSRKNQEQSASV